jgi:hypothetical protein
MNNKVCEGKKIVGPSCKLVLFLEKSAKFLHEVPTKGAIEEVSVVETKT